MYDPSYGDENTSRKLAIWANISCANAEIDGTEGIEYQRGGENDAEPEMHESRNNIAIGWGKERHIRASGAEVADPSEMIPYMVTIRIYMGWQEATEYNRDLDPRSRFGLTHNPNYTSRITAGFPEY